MDKIIARYPYKDENGNVLYSKIRKVNTVTNEKIFHFEREKNGQTIYNLNGCRKVPYCLPELLHAIEKGSPIFLVEGEKDADNLQMKSLKLAIAGKPIMVTTTTGALEWDDSNTEIFKNANVILVYDNDKTGIKRKELLCSKLYGKVKQLRVVDLPGLEYRDSHGLDISDWLDQENTIEDLMALVEQTPDYEPENTSEQLITDTQQTLKAVSIEELFELELPEREMILAPFLPSQGVIMLVAKRGVGKTHVALGIAYAVATGGTFLSWTAPKPRKVLYIDGEMPAVLMKERLQMLSTMFSTRPTDEYLQILTPDLQDRQMPDLSRAEGRKILEEYIHDFDLIVIDNLSCLFRSGYENESESWQEAQEWALDIRRQGKSLLLIHHAGKSGKQRGTSKREDILDAVIILKHPDDYNPEEGARFEVIFDKARHFTGADARSFQAYLQCNDSTCEWIISDVPKEQEINDIATMKKEGLTIKKICARTKLTKSQVEFRLNKAKARHLS